MSDIINENERGAEAMQQIASLIRSRALARNTQALPITIRSQDLLIERNELITQLEKLQSELTTVNASKMALEAEIPTIRQRMDTASQRVNQETTLSRREQVQGNIGDTHRSARSAYDTYRTANPTDTDTINQLYSDYIAISSAIHDNSQERVIPLVDESNGVLYTLLAAEESLSNLTSRQTTLLQEIADLEAKLEDLNRQSNELNRARGGKKRRQKKGTKVKRGGAWTLKYKRSINCMRPKGFSQKQYCKYGRKSKTSKTSKKYK
jgi:predicted  nucleic acid-binding Zn-ribbon protein